MAHKKQHYVEVNYLKEFSKDRTKFEVYLLEQGRVLREKPVRDQCQEDWYYEKGGYFEGMLREIEDIVAKLRKDVAAARNITLKEGNEEHRCLAMGAIIQRVRGPGYLDRMKDIAERTNQVKARGKERGEPLDRSDLLGAMIGSAKLIYDLDLRILRAGGADLMTSDNPVAAQNRIVKRHNQVGNTGVGMVGLELVWPLNPSTALYFFDGASYQCVGDFGETIQINEEETDEINGLQVQNALRCLYAQEWTERMTQTAAGHRKEHPPDTGFAMPEKDGAIILGMSKQDRITMPWHWKKSACRTEAKAWSDIMGKRRDKLFQELDSGGHHRRVNDEILEKIASLFDRSALGKSLIQSLEE